MQQAAVQQAAVQQAALPSCRRRSRRSGARWSAEAMGCAQKAPCPPAPLPPPRHSQRMDPPEHASRTAQPSSALPPLALLSPPLGQSHPRAPAVASPRPCGEAAVHTSARLCAGIFRVSVAEDELQEAVQRMQGGQGGEVLQTASALCLASLIKRYLRELPSPLWRPVRERLAAVLEAGGGEAAGGEAGGGEAAGGREEGAPPPEPSRCERLRSLLPLLPRRSADLVVWGCDAMLAVVEHEEQNRMNSVAIASVMAPVLMRGLAPEGGDGEIGARPGDCGVSHLPAATRLALVAACRRRRGAALCGAGRGAALHPAARGALDQAARAHGRAEARGRRSGDARGGSRAVFGGSRPRGHRPPGAPRRLCVGSIAELDSFFLWTLPIR